MARLESGAPWVEMYNSGAAVQNSVAVPQKIKVGLLYDPKILLGTYPKELKTGSQRDSHIAMARAVLFTMAKMWMQPKWPSADGCIRKF